MSGLFVTLGRKTTRRLEILTTLILLMVGVAWYLGMVYFSTCVARGERMFEESGLIVTVLGNNKSGKVSLITNNPSDGFLGVLVDAELYVKAFRELGFEVEQRFASTSFVTAGGPSTKPIADPPLGPATKHLVLYIEGDFRTPFRGFLRQYLGFGRVDYSRYCRALHAHDHIPCTTWLTINQDFPPDANALGTIDVVLTKTEVTTKMLETYLSTIHTTSMPGLGPGKGRPEVLFTKHSSMRTHDALDINTKNFSLFLHYNRGSRRKNSDAVYKAWLQHPEWPTLVFVHPRSPWMVSPDREPTNLIVHEYLSPEAMRNLSAAAGVWICLSSTEGYGHYLNEGRAASALVVTTDLAPMNEMVTADSGVLVPVPCVTYEGYMHIPTAVVEIEHVENGVQQVLALSHKEKQRRAMKGRKAFGDDYAFLLETLRHRTEMFFGA
jgi:hypothetical protein